MHVFQLYSTLNKVTNQCRNINESQLIEFLFHGNNHVYNLVRDFHCHPLLIISKRNKKKYIKFIFFSYACHVEHRYYKS
jgi:hypothetical protein